VSGGAVAVDRRAADSVLLEREVASASQDLERGGVTSGPIPSPGRRAIARSFGD
jgi:hypothetical protein